MRRISSGINTGRPADENVTDDPTVLLLLLVVLLELPDERVLPPGPEPDDDDVPVECDVPVVVDSE